MSLCIYYYISTRKHTVREVLTFKFKFAWEFIRWLYLWLAKLYYTKRLLYISFFLTNIVKIRAIIYFETYLYTLIENSLLVYYYIFITILFVRRLIAIIIVIILPTMSLCIIYIICVHNIHLS